MRSATSGLLVAAVAAFAAGCGNYSTEDLRFLSALPYRQHLTVTLPANTGSGPAALTSGLASTAAFSVSCPPGTTLGDAEVWKWAKPTSDGLNKGVYWIVGLIDAVRRVSPTHRDEDLRRWGPFDDDKHPGREIQIVIERSWPSGPNGLPRYDYRFEGRVRGTTAFTPLLYGTFVGPSASHGSGSVTLDFDAFWALGVNDAGTPRGSMDILYDRASDPVTIDLALTRDGFDVVSFNYGYAGYTAGSGSFAYKFRNVFGDVLEVRAAYAASGAGRLSVVVTPSGAPSPAGSFRQCWDSSACLVYVDDPLNLSCPPAQQPCSDAVAGTTCADTAPAPAPF